MRHVRRATGADVSPLPLRFKGYIDQNGQQWLSVSRGIRRGFIRLDSLASARGDWTAELARQGVVITTPQTRNVVCQRAEGLDYRAPLLAVDHTGWFGGHFIWPGAPVPAHLGGKRAFDARPVTDGSSPPAGCYGDWECGIRHLVSGQALPTFALCSAFSGLLLPHVPSIVDNPGFELWGASSIGKTTLLLLAASVLGRASEWVADWNTTANGLEPAMARCGGVLLLDEVGLFVSSNDPARARDYRNAIMRLAAGSSKARWGAPVVALQRFVMLSSTNTRVGDLLAALPAEEVAATAARLVTVRADAGVGLGVFDRLPRGVCDAGEAIKGIGALALHDHGWAGRSFVHELERRLSSSVARARLLHQVDRQMTLFRDRAGEASGLTGLETRVLEKFALVAAAGWLARRWGILPVARVHRAVLAVYRRRVPISATAPSVQRSAMEQVAAYVRRHQAAFYDLRGGRYPRLDRAALDRALGFLKCREGATWLLVPPARWRAQFGAAAGGLLRELAREGLLWVREHRQTQERVRRSHPKDRVYRILIDARTLK